MKTVIIDNGSSYLSELVGLIEGASPTVRRAGALAAEAVEAGDLVILSGSHKHAVLYDLKFYEQELQLIRNHVGPILGVCVGAELIAYGFGAKLEFLAKSEHGILELEASRGNKIFDDLSVYESHKWAITELPGELEELARSKDGIEVFRHIVRPIYGFQFHPEAGLAPAQSREVFRRVIELMVGA